MSNRGDHIIMFVKVMPFVYVVFYFTTLFISLFCNENISVFLGCLVYASPLTILLNYCLSLLFKLCKWHKIACLLPLVSLALMVTDRYIITLGIIAIILQLLLFGSSLISAYCVFFKGKAKETK